MKRNYTCIISQFVFIALVFSSSCGEKYENGRFIELLKAFDLGLITIQDLENVAYYFNASQDIVSDFVPLPKEPSVLNKNTQKTLKNTYRIQYLNKPRANMSKIHIDAYFGFYSGFISVYMIDSYRNYDVIFHDELNLGGVVFYNCAPGFIRFWQEL